MQKKSPNMTDYEKILTSMSTKFNETTKNVELNFNDDKTLKWRGLFNNKYASANRRSKKFSDGSNDKPLSSDQCDDQNFKDSASKAEQEITAESSVAPDAKEQQKQSIINGFEPSSQEMKKNNKAPVNESVAISHNAIQKKRILRRKHVKPMQSKKFHKTSILNIKAPSLPETVKVEDEANAAAPKNEIPVISSDVNTTSITAPIAAKRRGRAKKNLSTDESSHNNKSVKTSQNTPRLRRSERTMNVSTDDLPAEVKSEVESVEQSRDAVQSSTTSTNTADNQTVMRGKKKRNYSIDRLEQSSHRKSLDVEIIPNENVQPIVIDDNHPEKDTIQTEEEEQKNAPATKETDNTETNSPLPEVIADNAVLNNATAEQEIKVPKKRGRKPGVKRLFFEEVSETAANGSRTSVELKEEKDDVPNGQHGKKDKLEQVIFSMV